jgi:hypothetical protein
MNSSRGIETATTEHDRKGDHSSRLSEQPLQKLNFAIQVASKLMAAEPAVHHQNCMRNRRLSVHDLCIHPRFSIIAWCHWAS